MAEYSNAFSSAGYLLIGVLMTVVSMLTLMSSSVNVSEVNAFRICGGIGMITIGILVAAFKGSAVSSMVILLNGVLFIIAGEIAVSASSPVVLAFAAMYILMAVIALLSKEKCTLVCAMLLLIGLNLIARYCIQPVDGVYYASGILCILAALVAFYIGIAVSSEKIKLPML
jgi:hypothetical protein